MDANEKRILIVKREGFSLLELLVAVSILALTMVPIAYFYNRAIQAIENASIRGRALALAQERMNEILAMPYEKIYANNEPGPSDIELNGLDPSTDNVYDSNEFMFHYPLPLGFNPYRPQTLGVDNRDVVTQDPNSYVNGNNLGDPAGANGPIAPHINIRRYGGSPYYEYEPIGFYTRLRKSGSISFPDPSRDIRANPVYERTEQTQDLFSIYGRRTIILNVVPDPPDDDNDGYPVDSPLDGNATVLDPYPPLKGPANKFMVRSRHGARGKLVIVQVFWLPRKAPKDILTPDELNIVQLKSFIPAAPSTGTITSENDLVSSNNYLLITPSST